MSSSWQIYKFGGSSLGTSGRLAKVLELIAAAPRPLAVVVSALGDTTDWLILSTRSAADGEIAQARGEIARVKELAQATARPVLSPHGLRAFKADVDEILLPVERLLSGIELTRECSARSLDAVISAGERISSALVARALQERNLPGLAVDARELVATDDTYGAAVVDHATTAEQFARLEPGWAGRIPVITGFIGRNRDGHTTTLGRNGSDYTATLLAALLRAEAVTVWTDVLGVMTADPALVREAVPVDRLSYDEALELAYFGTRMFHPRTIIPLRDCGAALIIRSTTRPDAPGTRIDAEGNSASDRPTCITSLEQLALIGVLSRRTGVGRPVGGRVLAALDGAAVRVWLTAESTLGQSFSVVVPMADQARAIQIISKTLAPELHSHDLRLEPVLSPVSLVTLVAEAMGGRPDAPGRFINAIGRTGVTVRAVVQGPTGRSISCVVEGRDTAQAVRTAHTVFNLAHAEINVLLFGKGIVGGSLLRQIASHGNTLRSIHDVHVQLVGLAGSQGALFSPEGIPVETAPKLLEQAVADGRTERDTAKLLARLAALSNPVLVDCTGGDGMEKLYTEAFAAGINVVSANKKPLALPQAQRDDLLAAARWHYRAYHYETTVGAALPVIETLKNLVRTGDRVIRIEGAFSGTLGFLCESITNGDPLSGTVRRARDLGYTEPHPRDDLSGLDVARKAIILARELGLRIDLSDVALEPFVPENYLAEDNVEKFLGNLQGLDAATADRIASCRANSRLLRYLARIEPDSEGVRVTVGPVEVPASHPAATLRGAEAFVAFYTERYKEYPLVVRGAGAGGDVTASGVLADILRLAQNIRSRR